MKKNLNYFNYEERNGIFLLTFLLVLFCLFIFLQKRVLPEKTSITLIHSSFPLQVTADFSQSSKNISAEEKENIETSKLDKRGIKKLSSNNESNFSMSKPKHVTSFEPKPKKVFKNFKNKPFKKNNLFKKQKKSVQEFSINSTNPEDWKQVYGIGEGYASRIIKYQNWLGGFHSKEQIKEVYGITDSFYNEFKKHLLPSKPYRMLDINKVEEKSLGSHPYISWKDAKKVIKFRKHHYPIANIEEFNSILGVHDTVKAKLIPYLVFENQKEVSNEVKVSREAKNNSIYTEIKDTVKVVQSTEKVK